MNAPGPAAERPPPPPPPVVTSLTSTAPSKKGGTTSLAEALATSVADYVCGRNGNSNGKGSNSNNNNNNNNNPQGKNAVVKIAAPAPPKNDTAGSSPNPDPTPRKPRVVGDERRSSMGAEIGGLASFASALAPPTSASAAGRRHHHSAPIVSGTAAAYLAGAASAGGTTGGATPPSSSSSAPAAAGAPAVVSNASSVETAAGGAGGAGGGSTASSSGVPDPLAPRPSVSTPPGKCDAPAIPTSPPFSPRYPARYSDGAPVVAGTAAAQREAAAWAASVARIAGLDGSVRGAAGGGGGGAGGSWLCEDTARAVAGLGPTRAAGGGGQGQGEGAATAAGATGGRPRHGFSSRRASGSAAATAAAARSPKALSWVDHGRAAGPRTVRVTPDEGPYAHQGPVASVPSPSHQASLAAYSLTASSASSVPRSSFNAVSVATITPGEGGAAAQSAGGIAGGMDILAEIICHAPPMSVPRPSAGAAAAAAAAAVASNATSYLQPTNSISSYQDVHQIQAPQHPQQARQAEAYPQQARHATVHHRRAPQDPPSSCPQHRRNDHMTSPNAGKRVSAIPSYQEIYREMGMSSPQVRLQEQQQRQQQQQQRQRYSVEEVPLDGDPRRGALSPPPPPDLAPPPAAADGDDVVGSPGSSRPRGRDGGRPSTTRFGHVDREDVEEGKELYTRRDLARNGGHSTEVRDAHGNMREGCDSLCVGNLERDIREGDGLCWFLYSTDRANGGGALCQSYHKKRPVRVFRSSLRGGRFAPPFLDVEDDEDEDSDVAYRYDGLYMVCAVWDIEGRETESHPVAGEEGWQTFFLTRAPKKPLEKERIEAGVTYNHMGLQELWGAIQKMKGVKRPRKFQIPAPPVKLPPLKRVAIRGAFKDRKCPHYKKPEVEKPPSPLPPPKTVPSEKQRGKQQEDPESDSSSEESSDEEDKKTPQEDDKDDSESDSDSPEQQHHQQRQITPLSARTPSKVLTPRPRMNSISTPKKTSPTDEDDADSSDSETSTSVSRHESQQNKKKRLNPQEENKTKPPATCSMDFFPKRASAARCEAANREMFGSSSSSSVKRKSSGSSTTTTERAPRQPTRVSERKRTKVSHEPEVAVESSSDDEESDVVDQSILTVGSRVLVEYKESLFKATIRRRREKSNRHDFLIHYDGNKRTNVHWVPIERITEILEINVDTPPKRKRPPQQQRKDAAAAAAAKRKKKGGSRDDRRKSDPLTISRQDSLQQTHYDQDKEEEEEEGPVENGVASHEDAKNPLLVEEAKDESDGKEVISEEESKPLESGQQEDKREESTVHGSPPESAAPKDGVQQKNDDDIPAIDVVRPVIDENDTEGDMPTKEIDHVDNEPKVEQNDLEAHSEENRPSINVSGDNSKQADAPTKETLEVPVTDSTSNTAISGEKVESAPVPDSEIDDHQNTGNGAAAATAPSQGKGASDPEEITNANQRGDSNDSAPGAELPTSNSKDINTATPPTATTEPRKTVVSDVSVVEVCKPLETAEPASTETKDPLQLLAEEAGSDSDDDESRHGKESDENSVGSSGNTKQEQIASEPTSEFKFSVGAHVYVEYRQIFYSSTILKTRRKRSVTEYLVHYEGYKKSSNRWVKDNALHEVNATTTQRFEEQRLIPADILCESEASSEFSMTTRRKKAKEGSSELLHHHNAESGAQKKPPPRRMRSDVSEMSQSALDNVEPGVDFLPGSMVFVEWSGALYLAKMLKKRYSGSRMEYLISYDGFNSNHDAWMSIRKIYEVNPQTKRVFKRINSEICGASDEKPKRRVPPVSRRRETRKKAQDYDDSDMGQSSARKQSTVDMQGIEPGVEFLPGSTLFAEYKGGLCLAKMLKKRGRGDYMEYFVQFNGLKKSEEAWVSTALLYEINPQTKRMFRLLAKK
ncbi:hypothetical protein ACHAWF_018458 [Thalassiosira exigua]